MLYLVVVLFLEAFNLVVDVFLYGVGVSCDWEALPEECIVHFVDLGEVCCNVCFLTELFYGEFDESFHGFCFSSSIKSSLASSTAFSTMKLGELVLLMSACMASPEKCSSLVKPESNFQGS